MRLREATCDDIEATAAIRRRNGIGPWNRQRWDHYSIHNPFRREDQPFSWVLEDGGGRVVGTFGNIIMGYQWEGRRLLAAASSAWAVEPEYRSHTILLLDKYFRQKNVDFLLGTSLGPDCVPLFTAFQAKPIPRAACDQTLVWVTCYPEFVAAAWRRKGLPGAGLVKYPAAAALKGWDRLRGHNRFGRVQGNVRELSRFDERFDQFWSRLSKQTGRLLAVRDRRALTWHYGDRLTDGLVVILVLEDGDDVQGYLVMLRQDIHQVGLRRFQVTDLQVLDERPEHVETLMAEALHLAKRRGAHMVEAVGMEPFKRRVLESLGPHRRRLFTSFYYKAANSELQPVLDRPDVWDPSLYDGDATL